MAIKTATPVTSAYAQQPFPVAGYHAEVWRLPSGNASAGVVATISAANPGVVGKVAHGLSNGDVVTFTTTNALPSPLVVGTPYYVVNKADDTFQVSLTSGGTAINTSAGGGSGTHTYWASDIATITPARGRFVASVSGANVSHNLSTTGTDTSVQLTYLATVKPNTSFDVTILVQE